MYREQSDHGHASDGVIRLSLTYDARECHDDRRQVTPERAGRCRLNGQPATAADNGRTAHVLEPFHQLPALLRHRAEVPPELVSSMLLQPPPQTRALRRQ